MSDSLDDFFARKDRAKKGKGKKNLQSGNDDTKSEETGKEKRKEKSATAQLQDSLSKPNQEDDEWKEVEFEKDYSGLKIHSMTIRDKEEEIREQKLQEATEQLESKKNDPTGPWKTGAGTGFEAKAAEAVKPATVKKDESSDSTSSSTPTVPGKYVAPGLRNQAAAPSLVATKLRTFRSKAPEIKNQSEFPSLGAEVPSHPEVDAKHVPTVNSWKDTSVRAAVKTENKFDALSEN